ncbi:MAG: glycoside hydrolase family 99-like domain-containing protein [Azospirillaceae bacterium]|nr:glycoside hydrolase family 99-like domain-containing protein [Azospirillaceae bacterium]
MTADDVRLIAFYLPQFHPIPENDIWWGQGFTEWTKVAEAKPLFKGHHQPQLPGSLGFYDLRLPEAREAQARLARQHGIHGFCYYHYNFSGQRLLERPFNDVLASGQPDFPFCICWANENWTRRWDGQDHEILIKQNYSPENDRDMIRGLIPALQDPRYIRVKGAPLVLVYRTQLLPDPAATAAIWRAEAAAAGLPSLYLCRVESIGTSNSVGDPGEIGFDSACEFPPNAANVADSSFLATNLDPDFTGLIYDYETVAQDFATRAMPSYRRFHGVMPSWDNTARNGRRAHLAINASPEAYRRWLKTAIERTRREQDGDERLVFINAWNEWGEGCHLEPDRRYGFAWLEATRAAIGRSDGVGISDPPATAENVAALGQRTADLEDLLHAKRQEIKKQESQMSSLASEHAQDIAALRGVIAQRDQDIQHLTAHNQDLSSALTAAAATVTRRDQDIQHLTTRNQDLSSALTAVTATVTQRDQDILVLQDVIASLRHDLTEWQAVVEHRDQRLLALYNSTSWKFSAPVRKFGTFVHFLRGLHRNRLYPLALRPLHDLEEDGKRFVSTGEDPAFLLSWLGSVPLAGGWSRISFNVPEASSPLTPVLYFDTGSGFTPQHVLALPSITAGSVDIVTPLPANIKALRLDPMDGPGSFSLTGVEIREIGKIQILWHALRYNKTGIYRGLSYFYRHGWTATKRRIVQDLQWDKMHSDQQHWTTLNNRLTATSLNAFAEKLTRMAHHPRISILMPTYNTPEDVLRKTIQSVLDQIYPVWELCIVDDGSSQEQTKRVLQEYSSRDVRIKVDFAEKNMGVSHASNMALRLATGTFVVLLDHDDLLKEQAIFRVAECVETDNPDMLYSDEVLLSGDGTTVIGHAFRPAFSPELLRSHPYIVHMLGFRRQFLTDIGGFDESLSISQDYDLILRASEKARSIVHIPEILYCWRTDKNSAGHQKMQQVMDISRSVLTRHLERCGENGTVLDGPSFNFFDTRYPLQDNVKVAIIIPTKNHGDLVRQCIQSIEATVHNVRFDIVLIDHASDDVSSVEYFDTLKERIQILRYEGPFNFSAINNFAVAKLNKEYSHYLFCNNDIEAFEDGWLERMVEPGQRPSIGVVGAKLFYPDRRTIQHAGVCVGAMGLAEHFGKFMEMPKQGLEPGYWGSLIVNHEVSAVTAACLLISKEAFEAIDGFDEGLAVGFGDVDLCLKVVEKGYRVLFCPYARLVHHESLTRGKSTEDPHPQDSAYFLRKWKKLLEEGDPYFNPNLSLFHMAWHIKHPRNEELEIRRRVYQPELR